MLRQTPRSNIPRQRRVLDELIQEHDLRPGEYALFFVAGDGEFLPGSTPDDELEEASGFVLDNRGRVFSFGLGWDSAAARPVLTEWERVLPELDWEHEQEYREARKILGLR